MTTPKQVFNKEEEMTKRELGGSGRKYDPKTSAKHTLISIGLMGAGLYLAFLAFVFWFLSWWQSGIALVLMVACLAGAYKSFRRI